MGVSIGYRLKAVAIILVLSALFLAVFSGTQPSKAEARANLTAYETAQPNSWEPLKYNVTGTAPFYITHTLNWTNTRVMGNLGIGDGSVNALNNSSNQNVNYTTNNFMAGDVSMAPWDPGRLTSAPPLASAAEAPNATPSEKNVSASSSAQDSSTMLRIPGIQKLTYPDNTLSEPKNTSVPKANVTEAPSRAARNVALNDVYHTMLMGRPVDDLMYEYPLGIVTGAYFRLVGIPMPCGRCASVNLMCLGYGY